MIGRISFHSGLAVIGLAAAASFWFTPIVYPEMPVSTLSRGSSKMISQEDAFSSQESASISKSFNTQPSGKFLKGRHGITHFTLHGNKLDKLVVMAHGLGTSSQIYDDYVQPLVSAGFSVLTYDYFNHGWSKSDDYFLNYNKHAIVDQLEDLLDHVMPNKDTPVFGWVGHSTGGCVGVLADANLKRKISNFFYISPAFFANKPLIAQLADQIPSIMRAFFRRNLLHVLIKDGYTENGEISWGRDSTTGKYLFHDKREEHSKKNVQMFAHHPLIIGGIFNVLSNILRQDLLFEYVELLSQSKARTLLTWGELDVVVPYNQKNIDSVSINPNVKVLGLKGLGHEGPLEDSSMIVPLMVDFFNEA